MAACGAEIIVIVPLVVGPPSDEGLVSWQGTPLTGLGGGWIFWSLALLLSREWDLFLFFFLFTFITSHGLTDR